jgi:hypothetical protein
MKNLKTRLAVVLLSTFCLLTGVYAQLTPSADSYTNTADPATTYGSKPLLEVQSASQTTYIQFDLSSIPSGYTGANIAQATLKLYVNGVPTAGSFNVDYVSGSWSEGTITANNAPAPGSTIASSVSLTSAETNHYILIDITTALVAWLDGTQPNNGIALVGNSPINASFDSKENTGASHPPELDIVFAGGGGGGIVGVETPSGSGLIGGGNGGTLNLSLTNTCATNQGLLWNGAAWVCATVGQGTITGVIAGTDLTGGGSSGSVTLNLDGTKVPQLNAANTFTGNQTVNGNLSASGVVSGSSFQIGSNLFAFGSFKNANAFLGFAGNSAMTSCCNTATGFDALQSNTTGSGNTASGATALQDNTTGSNNTAGGVQALQENTTGSGNTASGGQALQANTTGGANTASGYAALQDNTTGGSNTASGYAALQDNTTGGSNTAGGYQALLSNTAGSSNSASGYQALFSNTTSGSNTASGYQSLFSNTTGGSNTASGYQSLFSNTTGSNNAALGYSAGQTADASKVTGNNNTAVGANAAFAAGTLTNAAAIGANAEVAQSNALVLGSISGVNNASASTNVGIGTTSPLYTLDVHGTGHFTGAVTFGAGQAFPNTVTSVGSGAGLTGGPITGTGTLSIAPGGVTNAMLANPSLTIAPGSGLTGGGLVTLGGTTTLSVDATKVPLLAAANTFTGNQTVNGNVTATGVVSGSSFQIGSNLFAFGSYANGNAFLGFAGNSTMTGCCNTASGFAAFQANTTGSSNTASGFAALQNNTTGGSNTASGTDALQANTTGSNNTGSGMQALQSNTTGKYNSALGSSAGQTSDASKVTGNNLTAVGAAAAFGTGTLTNATAIGSNAEVTTSDALVLGSIKGVNSGVANVNVGIGTTAPAYSLDVHGTGNFTGLVNFSPAQTFPGTGTITGVSGNNGITGGGTSGAVVLGLQSASCSSGLAMVGVGPVSCSPFATLGANAFTGNQTVNGNLTVTGSLSKGSGSFKIDHPLDPANKYLYHSFVESPDMMDVYNGDVVTNQRGIATVILPDYFEALNRDFRYQLTVIGQFAQAIVARKIGHNQFVIRTSKPNVEVSWQVTGIRHDAYADAHRIQVEEEKPPQDQGRYLHPELFGAPAEQAVGYNAPAVPTHAESVRVSSSTAPSAPLK